MIWQNEDFTVDVLLHLRQSSTYKGRRYIYWKTTSKIIVTKRSNVGHNRKFPAHIPKE